MASFGKRVPGLMLALALLAVPTSEASALSVPELMEFLEAEMPEDLILRLLESSRPPEDLTPAEVVALWEAGASDRLIEAVLPPAQEKPTQPAPAARFEADAIRAYYRDEPDGGKMFVLTNLDDDGRRLDGSPTSGSRRNLVTSRPWEPTPETSERPAQQAARVPPLQAPPPQEVYSPSHGPSTFVQTSPYLGFFYRQPISHLYPPGSYTHFKLYHQGGNKPGLGHYQMPAGQVFYNPPFPTASSHGGNQRIRWR